MRSANYIGPVVIAAVDSKRRAQTAKQKTHREQK